MLDELELTDNVHIQADEEHPCSSLSSVRGSAGGRPVQSSPCRLGVRELPAAVENPAARAIEPHCVVSAVHDRQAIRSFPIAAAELDGNRAVAALLGGEVVQRIGVEVFLLEMALGIVGADRPEGIDRHIRDVEPVDVLPSFRAGVTVRSTASRRGLPPQVAT